jgi:hypothetical protein
MASRLFKNDTLQRGWRTFLQSFLGLFLISLAGWLNDVVLWANGGDGAVFPDTSVLVKAGIAAMAAAVIAVVAVVQNALEDKAGTTLPTLSK